MPQEAQDHINVKIKVPPGYLSSTNDTGGVSDEFPLGSVAIADTVASLRLLIERVVPTHPSPDRQRLLYGGRALVDNAQTIGDALYVKRDTTQSEFVIHLLVRGEGSRSVTPAAAPTQHPQPAHAPAAPPVNPGNPAGERIQPPNLPPIPQYIPHAQNHPLTHQQILQQHQELTRILAAQQQQMVMQHMAQHHGGAMPQGQAQVAMQPGQIGQAGTLGLSQGHQHETQAQGQQEQPNATPAQTQGQQVPNAGMPQIPQGNGIPRGGHGYIINARGPNGQQFQMHQHNIHFQAPNMMGMPLPVMQQPQYQQTPMDPRQGLDRARQSLGEIERGLSVMRERARLLTEEINNINRNLPAQSSDVPTATGESTSSQPQPPPSMVPLPQGTSRLFRPQLPPYVQQQQYQQRQTQTIGQNDVTAYLLSSPQGPQALLLTPQHGAYVGNLHPLTSTTPPSLASTRPHPTPTIPGAPQPAADNNLPLDPAVAAAQQQLVDGQNGALPAGQDPLGPLQPVLAHVWLLFRILIFAYFLLGSGLGWQRPIILLAIGFGFWLVRMGAFGNGGPVRRWWDGLVGVVPRPEDRAAQQQQPGAQNGGQAPPQAQPPGREQGQGQRQEAQVPRPAGVNNNVPQNGNPDQAGRMPTPEEVANRLLNDQDQQQRHWLRERIRPVERAVALFIASLWPGIGEAHVRAREEEQRRRAEEEVAARRREEEAAAGWRREMEELVKLKEANDERKRDEARSGERSGAAAAVAGGGGESEDVASDSGSGSGSQGKGGS